MSEEPRKGLFRRKPKDPNKKPDLDNIKAKLGVKWKDTKEGEPEPAEKIKFFQRKRLCGIIPQRDLVE